MKKADLMIQVRIQDPPRARVMAPRRGADLQVVEQRLGHAAPALPAAIRARSPCGRDGLGSADVK